VQLSSSNPALAQVPAETVVNQGQSSRRVPRDDPVGRGEHDGQDHREVVRHHAHDDDSSAGNLMFTLTNNGGGRYSDQRGWVDNPRQIQVRSNLGGSASAVLKS
jgi:hypothetical protein